MELNKKVISPVVAGVMTLVGLGVGFGGGVWYQKTQTLNNMQVRFGQNSNFRGARNGNSQANLPGSGAPNMMGRGAVAGEITAKDEKSITVKLPDGSSKIVILSSSTKYTESSQSSVDKLAVGTRVAAFGTTGSDGTTTANTIEINPVQRGQQ